jgi:hypothetical protein
MGLAVFVIVAVMLVVGFRNEIKVIKQCSNVLTFWVKKRGFLTPF